MKKTVVSRERRGTWNRQWYMEKRSVFPKRRYRAMHSRQIVLRVRAGKRDVQDS